MSEAALGSVSQTGEAKKPPTFQLVDVLHYSQFYFWVGSVGSAACLFWPTLTPDARKGFSEAIV